MNAAVKILSWMALCCGLSAMAAAQQQATPPAATPPAQQQASTPAATPPAPPKATAQSEAGEPRADTSAAAGAVPSATAPPASGNAGSSGHAPSPGRAATAAGAPTAARAPSAAGTASKMDRLELGTATVTGSQEQPKVMYVVPWKRSDIGDLAGKPMNSLVDEIMAPVDRDVFKREVIYYQAVQADASQNGAPPKPAQQGEK
jgi:hypothetical protein